ncbi:nitrate/nitrite ABC transporter substrate- binding protein [Pirellula staleyi DSM 6068]|uniref:Nitrate/nitrite ABC transporter substrate-binding protein n=1 Tax=Pirellula staleyi (strain ATCC 27377 / DSM 6068 / ICPB 4128) TaxID=530564 RepID=D2R308_PIRSD|nr:ABC transporter substrate-binding protein [Pirellula staleyi]ADB18741.1 nitrate/nitrite ABC transporter substrate- binding protein [Pirellula staleyi DSM 6068]
MSKSAPRPLQSPALQSSQVSRRSFLAAAAAVSGSTLIAGCGVPAADASASADVGAVPAGTIAGEAPEVTDLNFGIIALTDCSPIVIAHEKGLFKKYGINSTVRKGASWAAIRDSLSNGDIHATHMLFGMPIASTMGLLGSPKRPMVIPWIMNRNGQAISLKASLKGKVAADPKALKPIVAAAAAAGTPMTFAMTFPPGTHAMWMRYFLAAGGINPDRDIALATIPPPQMVANMKIDKMDGFCVGEPWNARAIQDGIGYTAITTQEMWPDHPEKVCAFTGEFAEQNPKTVKAVLKALHEASVWLDDLGNRPEQAKIVSAPTYINGPQEIIQGRLLGDYDYGDGRTKKDDHYMIFSSRHCNYPQQKYVKWWLSQFRRWGMVDEAPDYDGVCQQVLRPDLYNEAMQEIGFQHPGEDSTPETLFDGVTFDPAKPEEYALSFQVHSRKDG